MTRTRSTEPREKGGLRDVVLVSHREPLIESFERDGERGWKRSEARPGATLRLRALDLEPSVDEIYAAAAPV